MTFLHRAIPVDAICLSSFIMLLFYSSLFLFLNKLWSTNEKKVKLYEK